MALSTIHRISKLELINYLENEDIPDDARLTLKNDNNGVPTLFFYWSDGLGEFGHTAVFFDAEAKFEKMKGRLLDKGAC